LGSKNNLNLWDESALLKQLNFKLTETTREEVDRVLGDIAQRFSFCRVVERNGRVVLMVMGESGGSFERDTLVFSFDSSGKLASLIPRREIGMKEMFEADERSGKSEPHKPTTEPTPNDSPK